MAVSALSLSHSGTGHNVDALQYYQQAFPSLQNSLRNNDDLVSDGLFLTHFLLLIYEVSPESDITFPHTYLCRSLPPSRMAQISGLTTSPVSFTSPISAEPSTAMNLTPSSSGGYPTSTCMPCSVGLVPASLSAPSSTTKCFLGQNPFFTPIPQKDIASSIPESTRVYPSSCVYITIRSD